MTEHDFDPMLRAALLESAAKRWTLALEGGPELVWTPERERRMARLLADPFHRAKRHSRPRWQRFLAAACLALLCSLTLWGLYTSSPTVRARAIWSADVTEVWYDDHVEFTFFRKGNPELSYMRPGWLPEGYVETSANDLGHRWHITYQNAAGERLELNYEVLHSGMVLMLDNEHSKREYVMIGNLGGQLFRSNTEGWPSTLLWFSEAGDVLFMLDGEADPDLLLQIAESVPVR
ncbi:DUF4367 domain-containing protein [Eubacteriales bacterium SGI.150]